MNRNRRSNHFEHRGRTSNRPNANAISNPYNAAAASSATNNGRQRSNNSGGHSHSHHMQQQNQNQNLQNQQSHPQNHNAQDEGDASPPMEQTMKCMTVVEEGSKIAFACYDEDKNEINIEQSHGYGNVDCSQNGYAADTERIVQSFIDATRPNLILISSKIASNAALLALLTRNPAPLNDNMNGEAKGRENIGDDSVGMAASTGPQQRQRAAAPTIPYQLIKSKAFDLKNCKHLILNKLRVLTLLQRSFQQQNSNTSATTSRVFGNANNRTQMHHQNIFQNTSAPSNYHALSSIIDFSSPTLLRTLGSLLHFLQNTTFRLEEGSTITVNSIRYVNSSQYMRIDNATIHALHIFATERHPLLVKGVGKHKEGFSLFTLLDRTKSKVGRQCLREWMLKPLLDPDAIRERQDGVELFLRPSCRETVGTLMNHLGNVGAVDKIVVRMQKCHSVPGDFLVLCKTLAAAIAIVGTLNGELRNCLEQDLDFRNGGTCIYNADDANSSSQASFGGRTGGSLGNENGDSDDSGARRQFAVVDKILHRCHDQALQDLHERIVSIVDQEATAETKESVVIHYGFHEELDNAKEMFDTLDETLSAVGSEVLQKHPDLESLKVVFLPQVGFLIAIDKRNHRHDVATNEFPDLPPDFSYVFMQDNEAFFKNTDMRRLDEEIGDLDAFIKDTESMIVSELEEDILDCEFELRETFGALAVLDCLLAFASCAADLNFVRPEILYSDSKGTNGLISIENGRHPLQELIVDNEFIPNDTKIDQSRRLNVVTGPNFSGKSCYTRQVGILVYMSHIGSFIPCDSAQISITDQILARISSVETCAVPQSTFQLDLTQMATILGRSTPRTLVLIDEFGKGTSPVSGIAVLTAALKKLMTMRCMVICTTHFLEIFSLKLLVDGVDSLKVLHMAVHIPDSDEDDDAVPLFKLEEGIAKSSAGVICAKMAGVHKNVTSRAREILGALKNGNQVKPIPANLNSNSVFQSSAKAALRYFLEKDSWKDQGENELNILQQKISKM